MLNRITFDNDTATLDALIGYFKRLDQTLAEVYQALDKEQTERLIFVREGSKIIRLRREEILYLEGYGDYVKIHRASDKTLLTQVSLRRFEECLDKERFCRIHRSYIVRLGALSAIGSNEVYIGDKELPIGNAYRERLKPFLSALPLL